MKRIFKMIFLGYRHFLERKINREDFDKELSHKLDALMVLLGD